MWVRHRKLATKIWFLWRMCPCATERGLSVAHLGPCAIEIVQFYGAPGEHAPQNMVRHSTISCATKYTFACATKIFFILKKNLSPEPNRLIITNTNSRLSKVLIE